MHMLIFRLVWNVSEIFHTAWKKYEGNGLSLSVSFFLWTQDESDTHIAHQYAFGSSVR